ncbi:MAG: dihydroneopterin aldolase [candidate division Zixibacteria bacterium]|nr:dihydroneopterin aldolase [candidate division Zixibacteria bacterium]
MDRLILKNIRLYGHLGVTVEEREIGANYEIDIVISFDNRKASEGDDIGSAIDYTEIYEYVKNVFTGYSCKLIESSAENLAISILRDFIKVQEVTVKLRKKPPFDAALDFVEIDITRTR